MLFTRLSAAALATMVAITVPQTALAADWAASFPGSAVTAHADAQGHEVAVLAVDAKARAAAHAVIEALRGAGGARVVRDGKSLGSLAGLDDPKILSRARALGADRVLIVRVFDGDDTEAIVSIYGADGATIGGFTARPGAAVEPPHEGLTGHDSDLAESVATVGAEAEQANEEFAKRQIVFDQSLSIVADGNAATISRQFHPRTGAGAPLAGAKFYRHVGRDDLATKYQHRRATRIGLGAGGIAVAVAGLGVMFGYGMGKGIAAGARRCEYDSPEYDACEADKTHDRKRAFRIGFGAGAGLLAGGLVLSLVAARINAQPVSGAEAVAMAETFNDQLRRELGLAKRNRRSETTATISTGPEGAGLVVRGRF